jgi:glycosyltransferase involved in cell wall biosynthesis
MILFLVDMPKPTHGMSSINQQMLQQCQAQGVATKLINTVPSYAAGLFGTPWWGLLKLVHSIVVCVRLLLCILLERPAVVYRSLNGGSGQVYDLMYLCLLRLNKAQVVLHHHSFSYLNHPSGLFKRVCSLLKSKDRHVVLGDSMRHALVNMYGLAESSIHVLSNLSFFNTPVVADVKVNTAHKLQLTHLANLSFEKGVQQFVETAVGLVQLGIDVQARLAGPCSTPEVAAFIDEACQKHSFLHYVGPVYADAKNQFFQATDLFIFPSRYINEAEPLVLYEAAQFGAFIAGTSRGCMVDQISRFHGYCYSELTSPIEVAGHLKQLVEAGEFQDARKKQRLQLFVEQQQVATQKLQQFIQFLKDGYVPEFTEV